MYSFLSNVSIVHFLLLSSIIFCIGISGIILNRSNFVRILMCIELMLLSSSMNFVAISKYLGDVNGYVFTVFIFVVAAAESAIGLAIILNYFRSKNTIETNSANSLKY